MDTAKKITKLAFLIALAVLLGIAVVLLRGPHISNSLKKMILPEIEMATGHNVIAQKIYINIFPLFAEAKEIKMFDEDGQRLIYAKRVKAYMDISGIFHKNLIIRRLVIKDPELTIDDRKLNKIISNIREYLSQQRKDKIQVDIEAIEIQRGKTEYFDEGSKTKIGLNDFSGEMIIGKVQKLRAAARNVILKKEGWPEISAAVSSDLSLKDSTLQINKLLIDSLGSQLSGSGKYSGETMEVRTTLKLLVGTIKKLFHLETSGDGRLDAQGVISYGHKEIVLDLKLTGEFYLQTLMELLRVKEKIQGLVAVKGEIKGALRNIKGFGTATLHKGNLYDVDIDYLRSDVSYEGGELRFTDAQGKLYQGNARASASLSLPEVNEFTLDISFSDVDSFPVFNLIGWDPGIQPGKITGTLYSKGSTFDPLGRFQYASKKQGTDVLGRIRDIEGGYRMLGPLLTLSDIKLRTEKTIISAQGRVDIERKQLDLDCSLHSRDVRDIASPYYNRLQGDGEFAGKVTGPFDDPVVSGRLKIRDSAIEGYRTGIMDVSLVYQKNLLHINEWNTNQGIEQHLIKGDVYFKKATNLFELTDAEFHLQAHLKNAETEKFVKIFYPDFKATGTFSSNLAILGSAEKPTIRGSSEFLNASLYDVPFDRASFELEYKDKKLSLSKAKVRKGTSFVQGDFTLYPNDTFSYKASSDNVLLSDLTTRSIQGQATFSFISEGSGSFDNPTVAVTAQLRDGMLKGKHIGAGTMTASINNKNIILKARILNNKIAVDAKGRLEGEMPWDAAVDIQTGRYDFLLTSFLKDVPEDLILSLNGSVLMRGTKKHISASSRIKHMVLSMYGHSFTNEEEMLIEFQDKHISLNTFSLRSGNTVLKAAGNMVVGKEYNLTFEGSSALSPFKSLSSKLATLKGNAEFVVEIIGDWETPKIYGGVTLEDGAIGLKDYPPRLSSLNGYLYIDNDRVILQKLSGKTGGGEIDISGILYLKKFVFKRFYVEAKLTNLSTAVSKDFRVNYSGNILYKGTPSSQVVSGEIMINNARYRERVEWKSWLLMTKTTEKIKSEISNLENAELNIKITGKDNLFVDNNVARATVSADMVLRGTVYRPILYGRLDSKEGTVYFRNNEFRILHASADFADPKRINPVIEIASETTVKDYKIKMNLEGQLDHFNMSLSSDPPLKEMDILALLTVGQTSGELKGLEGGIGAGEATSFVTGKLQDVIEERLKAITGLDRFQIDPHVSKSTGTIEPRVTVSKRLLGDKVFVTYTTSVGSVEEQIIKMEYFMGKNISLVGVRDERGILGGDIRFRFEFK